MEDDVYICKWKRIEAGFRLWVKGKPKLSVEGDGDVISLSEQLSERIAESGGAQHAVLEFDKPLPKAAFDVRYSAPEIVSVCGDERFEIDCPDPHDSAWFDQFFARPHCRECETQASPRNRQSLPVEYLPPLFDGGFIAFCNVSLRVFSEDFLQHLTSAERDRLDLIPIQFSKDCKKSYYELIGPAGPPFRPISTLPISGWRCDACGYKTFGYWSPQSNIHQFIARDRLPDPIPDIFTVGVPPDVHLCITAARWAKIIGSIGTRGLTTSQIGVAANCDVLEDLHLLTKQEQERAWQARNAT
jgi:hypothetical protein